MIRQHVMGLVAAALVSVAFSSSPAAQVLLGDPLDSQPAPRIETIRRDSAGTWLSWNEPAPDRAYTIQTWTGDETPIWFTPRAAFPWPLAERQWLDTSVWQASRQFYRVVSVPKPQRGRLISSEMLGSYAAFDINLLLGLAGIPVTVTHDVQVWKLLYETVDPIGGRTTASGALVVPEGGKTSWPLLSYQHGTVARRDEAPSSPDSPEQWLGLVIAALGYVTAMPDYLGLGDSPGVHPYHHAASEATAAVDMLRAAREFCQDQDVALNGQVFLVGYSQGGHATMSLHRELEEYHTDEFAITASAPMAGAYDLSGVTAEDALSGRPMPNPYYFALLLASYQSVYHFAPSLADVLAPPYDKVLPPLLDGQHSGSEINAVMPSNIQQLLQPNYLAELRSNPNHPFRLVLRDNDLYRWTPRAPMRLYHCAGDRDVIFGNSQVALASFQARGATHVILVDPKPSAGHGDCVEPGVLLVEQWFDSMRR